MKKIDKILLFVTSLVGIGFSIGILSLFYPIPHITYKMKRYQVLFPYLNNIFAGYSAILCVCFFLLLLVVILFPNQSSNVVILKSKGKLQFSKQTMESTVRYSYTDLDGIHLSKVKVKMNKRPEKIKIYVKLSLSDSSGLVDLTETIQEKISSALQSSLGITTKCINIKVVDCNPGSKVREGNGENTVQNSRVV